MVMSTMMSQQEMQQCIDNCTDCCQICTRLMGHCLKKGSAHADPQHINLLADCATICATSADFMLRESHMHHLTCAVCATVCEKCAEDCERLADDDMMRECAQTCRQCAESCRKMGGEAAGAIAAHRMM